MRRSAVRVRSLAPEDKTAPALRGPFCVQARSRASGTTAAGGSPRERRTVPGQGPAPPEGVSRETFVLETARSFFPFCQVFFTPSNRQALPGAPKGASTNREKAPLPSRMGNVGDDERDPGIREGRCAAGACRRRASGYRARPGKIPLSASTQRRPHGHGLPRHGRIHRLSVPPNPPA